jgi:hypothetical protein
MHRIRTRCDSRTSESNMFGLVVMAEIHRRGSRDRYAHRTEREVGSNLREEAVRRMTPPAKRVEARDPRTLKPGDRVLLRCEKTRHPTCNTIEAEFVGANGSLLWVFRVGAGFALGLFAADDGTLRDDENRIVEVLHAAD